mgnify:FL=1
MLLNKKIKSNILSKTIDVDDRKIGLEVECFIYNKDFKRIPVNQSSEYSASDLLSELNKNNNNGYFSLEPGGQVEWSSPPYRDIKDLEISLLSYKRLLDKILKKRGLRSLYIGVDPFYDPENIDLISQKKYQLMNKNMEKKDILGKWMMRNTSSIQINYDIVDEKDLEEIMFIADCIHPISSYLFSNSPFKLGKPVGEFNLRNHIWENTDKDRCRTLFDHKINHPNNLLDYYIAFMYEVPGIFQLNDESEIQATDLKLGEILKNKLQKNKLRDEDIQTALHQIFTNVRLKSLIEVRDFDCLPFKDILAPVAFFTGLIMDGSIRKKLIKEFVSWTDKERVLWNQNASSLEIDKIGPQNRKFIDWIEWVGDIAIEGLKRRENHEMKYFLDFYKDILKNGPLGFQKQRNFISSGLSLEKFIF